MNYYTDLPEFVSNSDLGRLRELLYGIERREGLQKIFDFGNLVDAKKTEAFRFDKQNGTLKDDGGRIMYFEPQEIERADLMVAALDADPLLAKATEGALFQHVILRKAEPIIYEGETVYLPMRMKADAYVRDLLLTDIKTTGCKTLKSFIDSIFYFNYDRQAAVYLDLARINKILYVGVSKEKNRYTRKHDVFKFLVERGDETYLSGLRKKNYLGYKYHNLIHQFNLPPITLSI